MQLPIRALLVTTQSSLVDSVKRALDPGAFLVRTTPSLEEDLTLCRDWRPHLVIVDTSLAGGKALARLGYSLQSVNIPPAMAVTWRDDPSLKLAALEQGADDVISVPFSPEEFLARALVIVRRTYREAATLTPILRIGDLEIDTFHRRVRVNGVELRLTALEQSLLYLLASNAGRVLTRDEILDTIWGADYVAESNVVDRHVHNLRAKLELGRCRSHYIATAHGRGYCFTPAAMGATRPSSPPTAPLARRRRGEIRQPGLAVQESH
uniref:Response regulator transcription factor n=1 Tax=Thermorudis peleae TaxID=1382356 RepID=A0A831TFS6_9BACT